MLFILIVGGLVLVMSDGDYFPWLNMAGLLMMFLGGQLYGKN